MRKLASLAVLSAAVATLTVPLASPAHAESCTYRIAYTKTAIAGSEQFRTSSGNTCTHLYAWKAWIRTDDVRGQYYSPSAGWQFSSQGWKSVTTATDTVGPAIIINIVDNVLVRGQTRQWDQNVTYGA